MRQTTLKGRAIVEGRCEAQALVSTKPISFLGRVDPTNGKIVEKNHDLYGEYARAVCTSRYVKERAGDCAKKIERSGGHVLTDVCTVVSWTEILGIKTMMTNSAKNSLLRTHIKQDRDGLCTVKTMPRNSLGRIRFIRMKIYFA